MNPLADLVERLRALVSRDRDSQGLAEEIQFHIERETEKNVAEGMSLEEGRRRAFLAFGGVDRWTERWREARGVGVVERWTRDLRLAARRLLREPSITLPALLTLALGIGVSTGIFSLVNTILLRPLPYSDPSEIVEVGHLTASQGLERVGQSPGTYAHYSDGNRAFQDIALYVENAVSVSVTDGEQAERVRVALVTPSFFDVLGVGPAVGRALAAADAQSPADSIAPVIISHGLWARRYGGDPAVVGGTIELNRSPRLVLGVMPQGFDFPHPDTDVWYPYTFSPSTGDVPRDLILTSVARLRPGFTPRAAEADLARLLTTLDASPELGNGSVRPSVTPLKSLVVEDVRRPLLILALIGSFVLLITLANVSGLFLVRAERRGDEIAMARALGAGRNDLIRRFLTEGILLAVMGGALGSAIAWLGVSLQFGFSFEDIPRLHQLRFGVPDIGVALLLSFVAGMVVAAVSILRSARFALAGVGSALTNRSVGGREWRRVHSGLAALQIAVSMALLVSSVVTVQNLVRVSRIDPGFESSGVLSFRVNPSGTEYLGYQAAAALHRELRSRLIDIPGATGAEAVAFLPLTGTPATARDRVQVAGEPVDDEAPPAGFNLVTPGYFELMGIAVLRGPGFQVPIVLSESPPVVISASLARLLFGERDPIGRRVTLPGYARFIELPPYTVVGVVGDVADETLVEGPLPSLYFPVILDPGVEDAGGAYPFIPREMAIVVHASMAPVGLVTAVGEIMTDLDPKIPVADIQPLTDLVSGASARLRLITILLVLAASTSLFLGLTGVYGIIAYSASLRTGEIGVRVAMGARSSQVTRLVMAGALHVAMAGLGIGLIMTYALTQLIVGQLYEVTTINPLIYAGTGLLLLGVVLAAAWLPAHRASRLDVLDALRAG